MLYGTPVNKHRGANRPYENQAIVDMPKPQDKKAVECLLGMVQYLSRFLPKLSDEAKLLRQLTENKIVFFLAAAERRSFHLHKEPGNIKSSS